MSILNHEESHDTRFTCVCFLGRMNVGACCVEEEKCHLYVLHQGCVFLCTDREAPELSVFAIS